jgi:hypothetical protein
MKGGLKKEKSGRGRTTARSTNKSQRSKNSTSTKDKRRKLRDMSSEEDSIDMRKARGNVFDFLVCFNICVYHFDSKKECEQTENNKQSKGNRKEQGQ